MPVALVLRSSLDEALYPDVFCSYFYFIPDFRHSPGGTTTPSKLWKVAVKLMVLRIIGCDDSTVNEVSSRADVKGKYLRIVGTIRMEPLDVADFFNQPRMEL